MLLKASIDDMLNLKIENARLNERVEQLEGKSIEPKYFNHH